MIKIFYRKFYIAGLEQIPADKPLLIASNHPNGFMEPIITACLFKRPLYFLVRGDVFKNPITRYFLENTNQIPIFRFKDGFAELRKNQKSISESLKVLQDGHAIMIFVEGGTKQRKHLRPLQKGMARIAYQTLAADPDLDLHVLPMGINFRHNQTWRSDVMLSVGQSFAVKPVLSEYGDSAEGIRQLMAKTRAGMISEIVHVDQQDDEKLLTDLADLSYFPKAKNYTNRIERTHTHFLNEKHIANTINKMDDDEKNLVKLKVSQLQDAFKHRGMRFSDLQQGSISVLKIVLSLLGLIPALVGLAINAIPYLMGIYMAESKAKGSIFYTSIIVTSISIFYFVYYLICIIMLGFIVGWKAILFLFGIPLGLFGLYYLDHLKSMWRKLRFASKTKTLLPEIKEILSTIYRN